MDLDPAIGRTEGDPEIRELLAASAGVNLGMDFLPEAFAFNPLLRPGPAPDLASRIVWFDAFVTNVDRTARNVNMLLWEEDLWLIDHGASLYFHHSWDDYLARSRTPFSLIKDHVMLPFARDMAQADAALRPQITAELVDGILAPMAGCGWMRPLRIRSSIGPDTRNIWVGWPPPPFSWRRP